MKRNEKGDFDTFSKSPLKSRKNPLKIRRDAGLTV